MKTTPILDAIESTYFKALITHPLYNAIKAEKPHTFSQSIDYQMKVFDDAIIPLLQEENKLSSQYSQLLASAEIPFDGKVLTIPQLTPYLEDFDARIRESAFLAKTSFFSENETTIDTLYDQLVKVRDKIAHTLGFDNFIPVGYYRMKRYDYNAIDVQKYREQVMTSVVPVASKLYAEQAKRIAKEPFMYYDNTFEFVDGNPLPKGTPDFILGQAKKMYNTLSPETAEFFQFMVDNALLDLVSRDGKMGGGYCTYLPDYKAPFIFSNFNGTSGDIDVLTHEAGHAFQAYQSRHITSPYLLEPTLETCEIHSMSMEFFSWPYMENFFQEDTAKYLYAHLGSAIKFIPYGVLVDHFQHEIYAHPEMTPAERKAMWARLEKQYLPHKDYTGNDFYARGGWWFQQGHIFSDPFYYIDYTLAQVCALQFWKRTIIDKDPSAWDDYLAICALGGTKSFLEVVELAKLKNPFEEGSLTDTVSEADKWLSKASLSL